MTKIFEVFQIFAQLDVNKKMLEDNMSMLREIWKANYKIENDDLYRVYKRPGPKKSTYFRVEKVYSEIITNKDI